MEKICAENFYQDFKETMKEDHVNENETYFSLYKLLKNKKADTFTKFINKTIIPNIIRKYAEDVSHEYFRIDAAGWVSYHNEIDDEAKKNGLKPHLWDLMIAVEHENDPKDWNDEVIKLAHIRCPLKVVIGYNACDDRDEGDLKKLSFVADSLQKLQCFRHQHDEFLIILGNCRGSKGADYTTFDYRGYVYDYEKKLFRKIS